MSNVKNRWHRVCREFESEAPAAEEMLARVVCSSEQFSFQMCSKSDDGSGTFGNLRQSSRQLMSWCWMPWIESWSLSPADRVVVDWRISEYELVDDNGSSHVDKPVVLFSEFYMHVIIRECIVDLVRSADYVISIIGGSERLRCECDIHLPGLSENGLRGVIKTTMYKGRHWFSS